VPWKSLSDTVMSAVACRIAGASGFLAVGRASLLLTEAD
jgi:hypothetical protein